MLNLAARLECIKLAARLWSRNELFPPQTLPPLRFFVLARDLVRPARAMTPSSGQLMLG
jgi:hypothetical protein